MNKELKPCPFCGGEATTSHGFNTAGQYFFISCEECGCRTRDFYKWYDGENYEIKAVEAWNTRKPIDEIVEQLENLKQHENENHAYATVWGIQQSIEIVKGNYSEKPNSSKGGAE